MSADGTWQAGFGPPHLIRSLPCFVMLTTKICLQSSRGHFLNWTPFTVSLYFLLGTCRCAVSRSRLNCACQGFNVNWLSCKYLLSLCPLPSSPRRRSQTVTARVFPSADVWLWCSLSPPLLFVRTLSERCAAKHIYEDHNNCDNNDRWLVVISWSGSRRWQCPWLCFKWSTEFLVLLVYIN